MLMAAQGTEIKRHKEQSQQCVSSLYRLCKEREETISHMIAECKMHTQKQYRLWRHYRVSVIVQWIICKKIQIFKCSQVTSTHTREIARR